MQIDELLCECFTGAEKWVSAGTLGDFLPYLEFFCWLKQIMALVANSICSLAW